MIQITSNEIKEKIENGETFLIDYFATWCMPCKMIVSNIESVESELVSNGIGVYKYDVETDMGFSSSMGIRGVPTLQFYKDGKLLKTQSGLLLPNQIKDFVGLI